MPEYSFGESQSGQLLGAAMSAASVGRGVLRYCSQAALVSSFGSANCAARGRDAAVLHSWLEAYRNCVAECFQVLRGDGLQVVVILVRRAGYFDTDSLRLRVDLLQLFKHDFRFSHAGQLLQQFRFVDQRQGAHQAIGLFADGQGAVFATGLVPSMSWTRCQNAVLSCTLLCKSRKLHIFVQRVPIAACLRGWSIRSPKNAPKGRPAFLGVSRVNDQASSRSGLKDMQELTADQPVAGSLTRRCVNPCAQNRRH